MIEIRVGGIPRAVADLARLQAGIAAAVDSPQRGGSNLIYARPIETGRFRSGRIARKAGPAHYLKAGADFITPLIAPAMANVLPRGAEPTRRQMAQLMDLAIGVAQLVVPVVSGNLRASLHTRRGGR